MFDDNEVEMLFDVIPFGTKLVRMKRTSFSRVENVTPISFRVRHKASVEAACLFTTDYKHRFPVRIRHVKLNPGDEMQFARGDLRIELV